MFSDMESLGRIGLTGILAYAGLVLFLRLSGKRTLSKMNAFDLVVTIALGSILATVVISKRTALVEGLAAMALLILLQYAVAWLAARAAWFRRVIKAEPVLLFRRGEFLFDAMRDERVARDEVLSAVRDSGVQDLDDVAAVVLETDGSMSVLEVPEKEPRRSTLEDVRGAEENGHAGA